jgi:maleate isomerase
VVLITPYIDSLDEREVAFPTRHGIEVLGCTGLGLLEGQGMASIEPGEWYRHAMANRHPDALAYFPSCAATRVSPIIETIECDLDAAVLASNLAMVWHALRVAGIRESAYGFGAQFCR